ncbi:hypothetical protein OQ968_09365 [Mycobacterium sp. 663a-19]|uniref:hypothetical protein n=1 Tax=Mycobacterium sp. 663a-19 TaxID=2986148 RepID=UPI002D1F3089|nr:hypothetical protein [Mycobacterium sp. 663a-19]MEB3981470.1 hypothetical protein [Mycobacterium sp. 663a-19]
MSNDSDSPTARRPLAEAVLVFTAAFALHGIDHLRRGMAASPPAIMAGGMIQGVFVVVAVVLILRHHRWASEAAIAVGFGSAALFAYAHLLPTFLPGLQDSFTSGPRINVTWFSWLTAVAEIGTGLVLGYAGLRARRRNETPCTTG